jgi:4-hydroxy-4-methyl-2-oxoglutarate aldolase
MPSSASCAETARALIAFGVTTVHEALGRRGLVSGLRLLVGPAFAGPAITVAIPVGDNLGIHALLSDAPAGAVACVASEGKGRFGVFGDLLALAARERGLAGLVIDDGVRDVIELKAPPIAARGNASFGTQKRRVLSLHEPKLDALIGAATARVAKEEDMRVELRRGRTSVDVLGLTSLLEKGAGGP